jgi:hypothetical protein
MDEASSAPVLHFLHIAKAGGTAIRVAIKPHWTTGRYRLQPHPHKFTFREVPAGEKVFFFLRDPIARFVSAFYSRQRQGLPLKVDRQWSPEEAVAFGKFHTPNELASALASNDEAARLSASHAMRGIFHVKTTFLDCFESDAYFLSRLSDVLFIGFQESLAQDFERLKIKLDLPPSVQLPDDERAHRNPAGLDKHLDDKAIAALRAWYARDYDFLHLCQQLAPQVNGGGKLTKAA